LRTNTGIIVLLFIVSFIIKLTLIILFKFDGFYGQDSYAYYDNSKVFIESMYSFRFPPNLFWPMGFYFLTFLFNFITLGNISHAALLVSLTAGSLLPGAVYLLSTELFKKYFDSVKTKNISLYAGIIICFSGVVIKSGMVIMSDMPGLLFVVFSVYYLTKYINSNKSADVFFSAVFLSSSFLIRYSNVIVIIMYLFIILYLILTKTKIIKTCQIVLFLLTVSVIFLPQTFYILKYGINYFSAVEGPGYWFINWNPVNFFRNVFFTNEGSMNYRFWNLVFYSSFIFHPLYLSFFGLSFLSGLYFCYKRKISMAILILCSWILVHFIYFAGIPFQSGRYALIYFPPLAIISALGITEIHNVVIKRIYLSLSVFLLLAYAIIHINNFVSEKNKDLSAVEYLAQNIPSRSMLLTFEITGAVNYYTDINHRDIYNYNSGEMKVLLDSVKTDIFMIVPDNKIQTQWKGLPLEDTYNYIKNNYVLNKLSDINYYSIYSIKSR